MGHDGDFSMRCLALILIAIAVVFAVPVHAAKKVALVIGNGAYVHANPLPNPTNDAQDMSRALQALGFTVLGGKDLDFASMGQRIGEFEEAARGADVTLFFYAGHGLQVNGRNYLVPVNAKLDKETSLQFEAIDAESVMRAMTGPGKTAIALLDACRDNPLSRSLARSLNKTRSGAVAQGLAVPAISGGGMLIGFATAPDNVAADGVGRNSPFTTALLKHMNTPGLEIQQLMTRVKQDVYVSTKETQEPWHNSSLRSEVYLVPQSGAGPGPAVTTVEQEWEAVKNSTSLVVLDAFIAEHRQSPVYVALAEERKLALAPKAGAQGGVIEEKVVKRVPAAPSNTSFEDFLIYAKASNDGNGPDALRAADMVALSRPPKNPGSRTANMALQKLADAPVIEELVAQGTYSFSEEASTNCRLDWLDRCAFLPPSLVAGLTQAFSDKGMDINYHEGNYFHISRIAGSDYYMLSNSPPFGAAGEAVVMSAVIDADLQIYGTYAFDLSRQALGTEAGDPVSNIFVTWAAVEGDDYYVSFDSSYRCTDKPRKFGFIAKFSGRDRSVRWVSPFNVSDANFVVVGDDIISANGGSCVDDYAYQLDKNTGAIKARFKTPKAIERMDVNPGALVLQLYEGAVAYRFP
jgi:uncharacterized caspase-like protein